MNDTLPNSFQVEWGGPGGTDGGLMLKAQSAIENNVPYLYIEPSNANVDFQNERVDQAGLKRAADYFLAHGDIDIGHFSMPGMADAAKSVGLNPIYCRIGFPVEVRTEPKIMVKAKLFSGDGPEAEYANWVVRTMKQGKQWFPSVGGKPGPKICEGHTCTLYAPLWSNIGLWAEAMNPTVAAVSLIPYAAFMKALTSGYGTDAATFTGGRAMQFESLEGQKRYRSCSHAFMTKILGGGGCEHCVLPLTHAQARSHFEACNSIHPELAEIFAATLLAEWNTNFQAAA